MSELLEFFLEIVLESSASIAEGNHKIGRFRIIKGLAFLVLLCFALLCCFLGIGLMALVVSLFHRHEFGPGLLMLLVDGIVWVYLFSYGKRWHKTISTMRNERR